MNVEAAPVHAVRVAAILNDLCTNREPAFTLGERERLGLSAYCRTWSRRCSQAERVLGDLDQKPTDLERYV